MAKFAKLFDAASGSQKLVKNALVVTTDGAIIVDTTTAQTLATKTLTAPVLSGSVTGTYTLAGTPTITAPTITSPSMTNATLGVFYQTLAGTGTTVADAAAINSTVGAVLATAANNSVGVLLPVASAGRVILLKNADAANDVLKVYAQVNSTINAIAANSALAMAAKTSAVFFGTSATNWVTIPLLPS